MVIGIEDILYDLLTRGPVATITSMLLALGLSEQEAAAWFTTALPDAEFGGRTPRELIADGQAAKLVVRVLAHATPRVRNSDLPPGA